MQIIPFHSLSSELESTPLSFSLPSPTQGLESTPLFLAHTFTIPFQTRTPIIYFFHLSYLLPIPFRTHSPFPSPHSLPARHFTISRLLLHPHHPQTNPSSPHSSSLLHRCMNSGPRGRGTSQRCVSGLINDLANVLLTSQKPSVELSCIYSLQPHLNLPNDVIFFPLCYGTPDI